MWRHATGWNGVQPSVFRPGNLDAADTALRTYTLRRSMSPKDDSDGVEYELRGLQATDDKEAVKLARSMVEEDDPRLLVIELSDAHERVIWTLRRGEPRNSPSANAETAPNSDAPGSS